MNRHLYPTPAIMLILALTACAGTDSGTAPGTQTASQSSSDLAGTAWELVEIQSMDDQSWSPTDPSRYTLTFQPDGTASMGLYCNRGRADWTTAETSQLTFSPIASTSALCQDDGLSERYAMQLGFVRSYVLRDGHLFLATYADGAIIEFRPAD